MADLRSEIPVLQVEDKLVIFPAYTFYLQTNGYSITQRNDKVSNRRLNELLLKANLAQVLGKDYQIPHIEIYSNGKWQTVAPGAALAIKLDAGKYGVYNYYPQLVNQKKDQACINVIMAFLSQYSSAKLVIR